MSISDLFTQCYIRDNNICQDCGSNENLEVHHILPVSQGGQNTLSNLKVVCDQCHKENYKDVHYPKDKSKIIPIEQRVKNRYGINRTKNTQVPVTIPAEILAQIETYWHENKLPNRSEAIRELVKKGLEKEQSE